MELAEVKMTVVIRTVYSTSAAARTHLHSLSAHDRPNHPALCHIRGSRHSTRIRVRASYLPAMAVHFFLIRQVQFFLIGLDFCALR
jgi:hypothetical protein